MITRTTQKTGNDTMGIKTGGYDINAIRTSLQAMTHDGDVTDIIVDSTSGIGLAKVVSIVDAKRHTFTIANGMIHFRGLSHRFTV
jgi:hypothetical protein